MRKPVTRKVKPGAGVSRVFPWQAPVRGWVESENVANMPDQAAVQLDNFLPEEYTISVRPGYEFFNQVADHTPIRTIMVWQAGGVTKLFVALASQIQEIVQEEQVPGEAASAVFTGGGGFSSWGELGFGEV